jgi:hypothetical protein
LFDKCLLLTCHQKIDTSKLEKVSRKKVSGWGQLVQSHGEEQVERWLEEGLKAAGLDEKELRALKGSDPRKLVLAELLWKRTTVSQEWLAEKLSMRSAANVSQQLRRWDRAKAMGRVPEKMRSSLSGIRTAQE